MLKSSKMSCPDEKTFAEYAEGRLSGDEQLKFIEHLRECSDCSTLFALTYEQEDNTTTSECPDEETFAEYAEGKLNGDEQIKFIEHLRECSDCSTLYSLTYEETTTNACPDEEIIARFAEGKLSQDQHDGIIRHMAACESCSTEFYLLKEPQPVKKPTVKIISKRTKYIFKLMPFAAAISFVIGVILTAPTVMSFFGLNINSIPGLPWQAAQRYLADILTNIHAFSIGVMLIVLGFYTIVAIVMIRESDNAESASNYECSTPYSMTYGHMSINTCPEDMNDSDFIMLCQKGHADQIINAINNGANVNARYFGYGTLSSRTPLMFVASRNPILENVPTTPTYGGEHTFFEAVVALVNAGADVNAQDDFGMTPLMLATEYCSDIEIIKYLINAGADVNAQDNSETTSLMLAAKETYHRITPEVITTLMDSGADPKAKDKDGKMAIDYAKKNKGLEKSDALRKLEEASF